MSKHPFHTTLVLATCLLTGGYLSTRSYAETQTPFSSPDSAAASVSPSTSAAADAPKPLNAEELEALVSGVAIDADDDSLNAEEMEVLVARIALYPDELIAVITAASLYPLQIVEAQRFLDDSKTNSSLKPKSTWDGSVVSLLNYPEIVRMMSADLEWTQLLSEAIVNQQQDVLAAIQQLREKAVAEGVIKTDDKVKVVDENNKIVIQPTSAEVIYVPQYQPEMLYEDDYIYRPVAYYPDPYPYYYNPIAPFFAGVVTGAIWVGVVDWNDGIHCGYWGKDWGNDIYIDCDNCFNNRRFNGRMALNEVDWRNIDRRKIRFDKGQLSRIDRLNFKKNIKEYDNNKISHRAKNNWNNRASKSSDQITGSARDVQENTLKGLKEQSGRSTTDKLVRSRQDAGYTLEKPANRTVGKKPRLEKIDRRVGKAKPEATQDKKRKNTSANRELKEGKVSKSQLNRKAAKKQSDGRTKSVKTRNDTMSNGGGSYKKIKKQRMPQSSGQGGNSRRCKLPECQ